MRNILIVSGHTDLNDSFANKTILEELNKQLPEAEYVYLDRLYPDFQIDVENEQQKLLKADIIVLQFPLFWYSIPSLMSRWIEKTFVRGFSHGSTGNKLKGKKLIISLTSGAAEEVYQYGGSRKYPIDDFLIPLKQFAILCNLEWIDYVYSGGLSYANRHDDAMLERMRIRSIEHAHRLVEEIKSI